MEALEDSNRPSMSDSISLYERYMRSFNVVDSFLDNNNQIQEAASTRISACDSTHSSNAALGVRNDDFITNESRDAAFGSVNIEHIEVNTLKKSDLDTDFYSKPLSPCHLNDREFLSENCSVTGESSCTDKSNPTDVPLSSEDSKSDCSKHPKPVIITSLITMENSNNAVDSVPMFSDIRSADTVFKLPNSELSFNGTLKHVQRMKPIVDPSAALSHANKQLREVEEQIESVCEISEPSMQSVASEIIKVDTDEERSTSDTNRVEESSESTGDSQYQELHLEKCVQERNEEKSSSKWTLDVSTSSLEASFDSGVRSPDMFSEDDDDHKEEDSKDFWGFLKDYEAYDKKKVRKMEETLQGVLPPPSVTILKTDVNEMLKKYYCFLPAFNENAQTSEGSNLAPSTPKKGLSFIKISTDTLPEALQETDQNIDKANIDNDTSRTSTKSSIQEKVEAQKVVVESECNISKEDNINLKMCTEAEVKETNWPEVLKCRHFDVHYNITKFSERMESLALRCGQRYVGGETDSSVTIYSGGLQSPSSASKRKAMRLKMAQAKSPGRRLSHLARRRQAFCSAATVGEKAHCSSKMVLIDKNFFPHRKLINSSERKSPRVRRTPGKRTPGRKTPGKKTPAKTPKTRSGGGSSKKKAMRRLLMDPETLTRSQPTRETSKRALFISPDNRKAVPQAPSTSVPVHAMKSKRALFGSPVRAETKSLDGSQSDHFLKRKRDMFDDSVDESRNKIAKSLSFGGDVVAAGGSQPLARRASEMFAAKNMADLDEHHRKKLLWAVSEALRVHGWRMQSAGFREKASSLARLTRRLLTLPAHAARLAAPKLSTSETFLKIARQYVFAIIQGRSVEECFQEEKARLSSDATQKVTGYISASAYQQLRAKQSTSGHSQIKENTCEGLRQDQPRSNSKNVLQDKMLNVDSSSNSSSGLSMLDKSGLYKSNSMPSFEEAAKMRARRQISFDNVDFPKR